MTVFEFFEMFADMDDNDVMRDFAGMLDNDAKKVFNENEVLKNQLKEMITEKNKLLDQLKVAKSDVEELKTVNDCLNKRVEKFRTQAFNLMDANKKLVATNNELKEKNYCLCDNETSLKASNDLYKKNIDVLAERASKAEKALENLRFEYERLNTNKNEEIEKLAKLLAEYKVCSLEEVNDYIPEGVVIKCDTLNFTVNNWQEPQPDFEDCKRYFGCDEEEGETE